MNNYKVVCGFNGTVYSRHQSEYRAEQAARREQSKLRHPNCGDLAQYVEVVPIEATFSRIAPADNEHGCMELQQARWSVWP